MCEFGLIQRKRQWQGERGDDKTRKSPRGRKFVRKEYRMMSERERAHLQVALNALKEKRIDNISIWDLHILIHYPNSAPAAHWGTKGPNEPEFTILGLRTRLSAVAQGISAPI